MEKRQNSQDSTSPYRKPVTWMQDQVHRETIKFQKMKETMTPYSNENGEKNTSKQKKKPKFITEEEYERLKLKPPKNLQEILNYDGPRVERWPEILKLDQALSPWERQKPVRSLETGVNVTQNNGMSFAPRWPESEKHIPGASPWKEKSSRSRSNSPDNSQASPRSLDVKRWPENKHITGMPSWDRPLTPSKLANWTRYSNAYYRRPLGNENEYDPQNQGNDDANSSFYSTQYMHDYLQFPDIGPSRGFGEKQFSESEIPLTNEEFFAVQEIRRRLIEVLAADAAIEDVEFDYTEVEKAQKLEVAEDEGENLMNEIEESYEQSSQFTDLKQQGSPQKKNINQVHPIKEEVDNQTNPARKKSTGASAQTKAAMNVYADDSFLPKLPAKDDSASNTVTPNRSVKRVKSGASSGATSQKQSDGGNKPQLFSPDKPSAPSAPLVYAAASSPAKQASGNFSNRPYSASAGQRKAQKYDENVFQSPQPKLQPESNAGPNPGPAQTRRPKSSVGVSRVYNKKEEAKKEDPSSSNVPETRLNPRELKQFKERQKQKNHPLATPAPVDTNPSDAITDDNIEAKRQYFLRDDSVVQNLFDNFQQSAPPKKSVSPTRPKSAVKPKISSARVIVDPNQSKNASVKPANSIKTATKPTNTKIINIITNNKSPPSIEMSTFTMEIKANVAPLKQEKVNSASSPSDSVPATHVMTTREILGLFCKVWVDNFFATEIPLIIKRVEEIQSNPKASLFSPTAVSYPTNPFSIVETKTPANDLSTTLAMNAAKSPFISEIEQKQKNYMSPIPSFLSELKTNQGLKFQLKKTSKKANGANAIEGGGIGEGGESEEDDPFLKQKKEEEEKRKQQENEETYQSFLQLMQQLQIPQFLLNYSSFAKTLLSLSPFQSKSNLFASEEGIMVTPRATTTTTTTGKGISGNSTLPASELYYDSVTLLGRGKFASVYCVQNKETVSLESIITPVKQAHQQQLRLQNQHLQPAAASAAAMILTPPPPSSSSASTAPATSFPASSITNNILHNSFSSNNPLFTPSNHHNLKSVITVNELIALKIAQFKDNDLITSMNQSRDAKNKEEERKDKKGTILCPSKAIVEEFQREILSLYHLQKHDHIMNLIGYSIQPFGIIMDYIAGQNLYVLLHNEHWQKSIRPQDRMKILVDISSGLAHIHSRKYIHRDLKPHNIIIEQKEGGGGGSGLLSAKIVDFGTAYPLTCTAQEWKEYYSSNANNINHAAVVDIVSLPSYYRGCTEATGTSGYSAPEIFAHSENLLINYAYPADIFSFSIILWEMMIEDCSKMINPLQGLNPNQAYQEMKEGKRPVLSPEYHYQPAEYAELIEHAWCFKPYERYTADGLFFELTAMQRKVLK